MNLGKHAGMVACIGLALTLLLGIGLTMVQFSTSDSNYLNGNDPAAIGNREYTSLFGGDPIVVLFTMKPGTTVDNLLTPANQATMQRVDRKLTSIPAVYDVISPLTALQLPAVLLGGSNLSAQMFISAYERDPSATPGRYARPTPQPRRESSPRSRRRTR